MSKKCKGVVLNTTRPYGVGVYEDSKAGLKHQALMQDYQELQKETDVMRSKLETSKQIKMMLAAEVRFLRRRYEYLMKAKITGSEQNEKLVHPMKQKGKKVKEPLPPVPKPQPRKKHCTVKQVGGKMKNRDSSSSPSGKEAFLPTRAHPVFDLNEISTGDEEVMLDEVKKSSIRDDMQNDVKLSICRNAGESSSRVGKRKISWMDPVVLSV